MVVDSNVVLHNFMSSGFGEPLVFDNKEDMDAAYYDHTPFPPDNYEDSCGDYDDEDRLNDDSVGDFPPKVSSYADADLSKPPRVHVDKARYDIFGQYKDEYDHIMKVINNLPSEEEEGSELDNKIARVITLLLGPNSRVYRVFHDCVGLPYKKFCQFMATFYFVCKFNTNLNKLWQDDDIKTDRFMPPKLFYKVLRKMDEYGRGSRTFSKLFWEELEDAFNNTMAKFKGVKKYVLTLDDDKVDYNFGPYRDVPIGQESRLKYGRHTRRNRKGITSQVLVYAASDIPVQSKFEHEDHCGVFDSFIDLMRGFFNFRNDSTPNLSGIASLAIDRAYMRIAILQWWIEAGGDVLGTLMRGLGFVPFTWGKEGKQSAETSDSNPNARDRPQNIPLDSFKSVYQKTAHHNNGKAGGTKTRALTCVAYASGHSSAVPLFLTSRESDIEWDLVLADGRAQRRHSKYKFIEDSDWLSNAKRCMDAFQFVIGKGWFDVYLEDGGFKSVASDSDGSDSDSDGSSTDDGSDADDSKSASDSTTSDAKDSDAQAKSHPAIFELQGVSPVTSGQLDSGWWLCRMLSLTSSTTDSLIVAAAPHIGVDHPRRKDFERVLRYTGQSSLLSVHEEFVASDEDSSGKNNDDVNSERGDDDLSVDDDNISVDDDMVNRLMNPEMFEEEENEGEDGSDDDDGTGDSEDDSNNDMAAPLRGGAGRARSRTLPSHSSDSDESNDDSNSAGNGGQQLLLAQPDDEDEDMDTSQSQSENEDSDEYDDDGGSESGQGTGWSLADDEESLFRFEDTDEDESDAEELESDHTATATNGFMLYNPVRNFGSFEEMWLGEGASDDDVDDFLDPFLRKYRGDMFNTLMLEEAKELIPSVDISFVRKCLGKIGAPKSSQKQWSEEKARTELLKWIGMSDETRPYAFKTKPQMRIIADQAGFTIPYSLSVDNYRKRLGEAFMSRNSDGDASTEPLHGDSLQAHLIEAMLGASFMKPLKKGHEEGQKSYTTAGQRGELPSLRAFWRHNIKDNERLGAIEAIYRPGLVESVDSHEVRDSSDGAAIVKDKDGSKHAIPIEVKSRVSPNTFHKTMARFNKIHHLSDMPGLGRESAKAHSFRIDAYDERLLGFVPESHDLLQVLHHAVTYTSDSCFYLISSHKELLYNLCIDFPKDLMESYANIMLWLIDETLAPFWDSSEDVPYLWPLVKNAFKSSKLKSLNMTEHAFQCYLGLWREINVKCSVHYPLPPIARIIPLIVSLWNSVKGGGDTLTRLDNNCQERLGIRTMVTVASARILLNLGLVFHRCIQMVSSKDPDRYPTLYHCRNAASKRFTTKDSLKVLYNILCSRAECYVAEKVESTFELANCCPSPAEPSVRKSTRNSSDSPLIRLPTVAAKSGHTPGKGSVLLKPSAEFIERCQECDGIYSGKRVEFEKEGNDKKGRKGKRGGKTSGKKGGNSSTRKKVEPRRACHVCKRKTRHFCFRCRRYLCDESPKDGKDRNGKKYPKHFCVHTPNLTADGSLARDDDKQVVFDVEYGELTCFVIAHQKMWDKKLKGEGVEGKTAVSEESGKNNNNKKEKKKKKKKESRGKKRRRR